MRKQTNKIRPLSTLTVEEGVALWNAVMPLERRPFKGAGYAFKGKSNQVERVVFMQGCERLGISFVNRRIWADSDLIPLSLSLNQVNKYLDSIGVEKALITSESTKAKQG